jgi:diguanylate cyclase (GGDEF)-like protein
MPTGLLGLLRLREALTCRRCTARTGGVIPPISRLLKRDHNQNLRVAITLLFLFLQSFLAHADPTVLTSAGAIHELPWDQAAKAIPVHLIATVTYYQPRENVLFVEDSTGGVYIRTRQAYPIHRGDLVEVSGVTATSFRSMVATNPRIQVLGKGRPLTVKAASYPQLLSAELDCQYVSIRGVVRSANLEPQDSGTVAQLEVLVPGGIVQAFIQNYRDVDLSRLIGAEIQLSGIAGGIFNARFQLMQTRLYVSGQDELKILREPRVKPNDLPLTGIDDVVQTRFVIDRSKRVRVEGTVTYSEPGNSVVIQHGNHSLLALTRQVDPIELGSVVDVTGFAENREYSPSLEEADVFPTGRFETVIPKPLSYQEAISGVYSNSLITLKGRILSELRTENSKSMVVMVDEHPVNVVLPGSMMQASVPDLPPNTVVQLTGICRITLNGGWGRPLLFRLDMRQAKDLEVIARPSWWTVAHLLMLLSAVVVLFLVIMIWAVVLRRRVASQTAQIDRTMQVERQRSRLLEEINSKTPLEQLLEDISSTIAGLVPDVRCCCVLSVQVSDPSTSPAAGSDSDEKTRYEIALTDSAGERIGVFRIERMAARKLTEEDRETLLIGAELANLAVNQRRMYSELTHQSMHDQLTGLPNRRYSDAKLETAVRDAALHGKRLAVAYIDIDRFKEVNDQYGHKVGDLYLQQIARRLEAKVRSSDMLARIGGDEFLLLANTPKGREEAEAYKLRFQRCFDNVFVIDGIRIRGAASIGIAVFPDHGSTAEELKRHADIEMYFAKHHGREEEEQPPEVSGPPALFSTADLETALAADQFRLFYQPQFSSFGRLRGLEALVRLEDPVLGMVPPNSFIVVAESTDFIIRLGAWVLRQALSDAATWRMESVPGVRIVVNIAARQIEQPDFADQVVSALKEFGIAGESLELEITERTVVSDLQNAVSQLNLIRSHGVTISLDDFGIEHSSLSVLHKLPFDTVKIDRSFVQAIGSEPGVLHVIEAIVSLGRSMEKRVVAEGVENDEQIAALLQIGDMDFQGYAFSRPVPAGTIASNLEGWRSGFSGREQETARGLASSLGEEATA